MNVVELGSLALKGKNISQSGAIPKVALFELSNTNQILEGNEDEDDDDSDKPVK